MPQAENNWTPTAIDFFSGDAYILEYEDGLESIGPRIIKIDENGIRSLIFDYDNYKKGSIEPQKMKNNDILWWIGGLIIITISILVLQMRRKNGMKSILKHSFNIKLLLYILLLGGLISACSNTEKYEKIAGEWKCSSWINKHHGNDKCSDNVRFEFQLDKEYNSMLGSAIDSGRYKIVNDMLYVTPDGKKEFGVKITRLENDTMVFLMNRAGEEEVLTLVRAK